MVPSLSIAFMAVSGLISFGLPVALFLVWRRRYGLKVLPALVGAAAFILFAMVLEGITHQIILRPRADGYIALAADSPALYVLYAVLAAGVFEETARFLSFRLLKKGYGGLGTGLSYGIGHGGIEAVLLTGLASLNNIVVSAMVNSGNTAALGNDPAVLNGIAALAATEPTLFLVAGLERVLAISVHISLSMLVWCAVTVKGKLWLYPAAIILHVAANLAAALYQVGAIKSTYSAEGVTLVCAALIAAAAYEVCKIPSREAAPEPQASDAAPAETETL
jgi:uncharacterized membrane protein YhfC